MSEKGSTKGNVFWGIVWCIFFLVAIIFPFFDAYVLRPVSFERQIEPAFMNGLLTASSILFGFSSLIARQKWVEKILWLALLPSLGLIVFSGGMIIDVAVGRTNSAVALLILSASFNVNAVSSGFIYIGAILSKKATRL